MLKDALTLTFTFGRAAPHAVVHAVDQCVFEALGSHGTLGAELLGDFDTHTLGRKETFGFEATAPSTKHPLVLFGDLFHHH